MLKEIAKSLLEAKEDHEKSRDEREADLHALFQKSSAKGEPARETKTKTKADHDLEDLFRREQQKTMGKGAVAPVSKEKPETKTEQPKGQRKHKLAGAQKTRSKVAGLAGSPEIAQKLSSIDYSETDEISDAEAAQRAGLTHGHHPHPPVTPETLPAVINKHLTVAGQVEPEWHMVKHLPGYMASAIRKIGRAVFAPFTRTPIEEIQVIANLMGGGPNDKREMNAVLGHLAKHAHRDRDAEIVFHDKIPDYGAQIKVFKDSGITYMAVKDFAGEYIYAWPTGDEHAAVEHKKEEPKRLTKEGYSGWSLDQLRQELDDIRAEIRDAKDSGEDAKLVTKLCKQRDKVKDAIDNVKSKTLKEGKMEKLTFKQMLMKPRDPKAANLQALNRSGSAGAHKDKKKADKQGDFKHKKRMFD